MAVAIVDLAAFGIAKNLVGFRHFVVLDYDIVIAGILIRVILLGQTSISLGDFDFGDRAGHPKNFVIAALVGHFHSQLSAIGLRKKISRSTPMAYPAEADGR